MTGLLRKVFRGCTLCEASCGLALELEGDRIVSVRGDDADALSHGYICAKGVAIADVHYDPDRLRSPMRKTSEGKFEPIGWNEAFEIIGTRLTAVRARHGADAIAIYPGNPIIHNHGALLLRAGFLRAFGTRNSFSAGSQDTSPRFAASFHLYGSSLITPVPDIDRTHYFLCIGANPPVSNGSFMTAPDVRRRLRAIRERGGRIVVVDPRRTETAREADRWVPIRPGGDAALLLAMTQTLVADGRVDETRVAAVSHGWPQVGEHLSAFAPERVAAQTGIAPETIRSLAREFADDRPTRSAHQHFLDAQRAGDGRRTRTLRAAGTSRGRGARACARRRGRDPGKPGTQRTGACARERGNDARRSESAAQLGPRDERAMAARRSRTPGVSANDWTDDQDVEALVGQLILNGVPVRLRPALTPQAQ
jgi:anaerobic selenocysteine-containing dehydrogenase